MRISDVSSDVCSSDLINMRSIHRTQMFRLRARCGNGTGARLACRLVMAVLVFKRSRQGGTQVRRLMSHPAATILATLTAEDCMKEESSRTLARQWAMLRGIPR